MVGARVKGVSSEMETDSVWTTTVIHFEGGQRLETGIWRLIKQGRVWFSSFDYGPSRDPGKVSERIDTGALLARELAGATLSSVTVDEATGDLLLEMGPGLRLEALRLSLAFEEWELTCAPGLGEYSNHIFEA